MGGRAGSRAGLDSERGRGRCGLRGWASVAQRDADLWDLPVSGKGRRARGLQAELSSGEEQAGPSAGPHGRETGRAREERKGVGLGLVCWVLGWVPSYFFLLSISIFLFQTLLKLKPFEFKFKFEFSSSTQTNKTMHQHECNNRQLNL